MPEGMRRGSVGEYGWVKKKEKKEKKKKEKRKENILGNALIEQRF